MNTDHEIYLAREDLIPLEDKARLDGYLKGRADQVLIHSSNRNPKFAASIPQKKKRKKKK